MTHQGTQCLYKVISVKSVYKRQCARIKCCLIKCVHCAWAAAILDDRAILTRAGTRRPAHKDYLKVFINDLKQAGTSA